MRRQIFIGLSTEGTTDIRFLSSVVRRTFEDVALWESTSDIDIEVYPLQVDKRGLSFPEYVAKVSAEGVRKYGIMTLAIHTDADRESYEERMMDKIEPARRYMETLPDEDYCKLLTPVIPVRMIEAWMLADKDLLREEIGTRLSEHELGIERDPESMANPKQCIEEAIAKALEDQPRRRHKLSIADLYEIMGDKISLDSLKRLPSFCKFVSAVQQTYRELHYIV